MPKFPPVLGTARTFNYDSALLYFVSEYTKHSRFVLYDNGDFALQYGSDFEYRGRYSEANGVITFEQEVSRGGGPWGATGTLQGDLLTVRYSDRMRMSDFEDAVYRLTTQ
jgi:hypothetical protein